MSSTENPLSASKTRPSMSPVLKTVAVLGASYGGHAAAKHLAESLPQGWRVVVVDRNTHFNHLYVYPRFSVLPSHAHKGFIPYSHIFGNGKDSAPHTLVNACVTKLNPHSVALSRSLPGERSDADQSLLHFDYAIYALGSHMPAPINLWGPLIGQGGVPAATSTQSLSSAIVGEPHTQNGSALSEAASAAEPVQSDSLPPPEVGSKRGGIQWLERSQKYVEKASSVLVVGGGALGIQYATDIADIYPNKKVTLLHSRTRLLPRFDEAMHSEILAALSSLNVNTVLGDRLDLSYPGRTERDKDGGIEHVLRAISGREFRANVILFCTGQHPNTELVQSLLPQCIVSDGPSRGMIRVNRALQIGVLATPGLDSLDTDLSKLSVTDQGNVEPQDINLDVPHPHLFAVGDAADTFGAINAGHTAYSQALLAANNILKLIGGQENSALSPPDLEEYRPGLPGIKMSIGRNTLLYQIGDQVGKTMECPDDLQAPHMWRFIFGREVTEEEMYE